MNKGEFIKKYLKSKLKIIILLFLVIMTFVIFYKLNAYTTNMIVYPVIVVVSIIIIFGIVDFINEYRIVKTLIEINNSALELINNLPKPNNQKEEAYQEIINHLQTIRKELLEESSLRYDDMITYYTTWTHQIKTPIASLKLKLNDGDYDLNISSDLSAIERYVEMAINYLKLDGNNVDYVFKKCSLDKMIKESIRKFSDDFILKKIKLDFKETNKEVITDEKWFCFVFEQLLSNALKYTNEGSISIYMDDEQLCIKDTGIGINASDLPRVFERGYTGFNGRDYKNATGLGLYLSKRILDKLNIDIKIESKVNEGTTVKLKFLSKDTNLE